MGEEEEEELDAVGPPSGEEEQPDLGPCCACGKTNKTVRNILMLNKKAPVTGQGWGCVQCGLPPDGASAVICDECAEVERPLKFVIHGMPMEKGRITYEQISGVHEHDMDKHPEVPRD